jgi:hypothetical protein
MVELAIGGGLALFLYLTQHKSTKMQRDTWESQKNKILRDFEFDCKKFQLFLSSNRYDRNSMYTTYDMTVLDFRAYIEKHLLDEKEFLHSDVTIQLEHLLEHLPTPRTWSVYNQDNVLQALENTLSVIREKMKKSLNLQPAGRLTRYRHFHQQGRSDDALHSCNYAETAADTSKNKEWHLVSG